MSPDLKSEVRYRELLDTAPDAMVVVDADEKIGFVNLQAERMFGFARDELLGQSLALLIPERYRPAHRGHVARFLASPNTRPMGSDLQLFGRRRDGSEIPIEVSLSPLETESGRSVSAAIRDVSQRKRLEAIAKLNADRLASAIETVQDAFALFDHKHELVLCNSVYRLLIGDAVSGSLIGRSYGEILAAWTSSLVFADEATRERFRADHLGAGGELTGGVDVKTRDGRSLRITERRTMEGGLVTTIWDLSDDFRRETELREARSVAESASSAKSDFLSSMSHELRTPLNAILGFAQLLQRDKKEPLSDRHKERVAQIVKGGEHLLRLIDDILDLSRIEAGAVSISAEPVSVTDVLEEVMRRLDPVAAGADIRLTLARPEAEPLLVIADRTRLVQILSNFGSNAIKYNRPDGSVTFSVSKDTPDQVSIKVADTGIGIPADKQEKLFQPFQRAGQETGPIEGTGIGLVITKRLAELMNGSVGFRSAPGVGSEFWLSVPVAAPAARLDAAAAKQEVTITQLGSDASRRVLYVEDNPPNVAFMRDLLSIFDAIELFVAPTAEAGIEMARADRPDVIIMDINLPGISGIEAMRILQADPATQPIPVIALTAAASERDRQRGMKEGFYRYLTKPVKVDELIAALESLLEPQA